MTTSTTLRPGIRLRSQVCTTEVIVVRPGTGVVTLTCGGHPMVAPDGAPSAVAPVAGLDTGTTIGKRYTADADPTIELLVTKAGAGTLADGTVPLLLKAPKTLPASD